MGDEGLNLLSQSGIENSSCRSAHCASCVLGNLSFLPVEVVCYHSLSFI